MIEVVFEEYEAANLRVAISLLNRKQLHSVSSPNAQHNANNKIVCLALHLDKGDLTIDINNSIRKKYIQQIYSTYYCYDEYINNLNELLLMAEKENKIRIWCSSMAYSMCGLYFVCNLLNKYECKLSLVELPISNKSYDGTLFSWGQINGDNIYEFLNCERILSKEEVIILSDKWINLTNMPLKMRININGNIISVDDNFFDDLIKKELPDTEFSVSSVINDITNKYSSILDDYTCISRLLYFVNQGTLKIIKNCSNNYNIKLIKIN